MEIRNLFAVAVLLTVWTSSSFAVVTSGSGGNGVTVGNSSLITNLDYADTFTGTDVGGEPGRPYIAALQPPQAYNVESDFGNPSRRWSRNNSTTSGNFSIASDLGAGNPGFVNGAPPYPGNPGVNSNTSGSGSDGGFTQTGGENDYGIAYGLRDHYVVQFDAVQAIDRVNITSGATPGNIFTSDQLAVFFRGNGTGQVSLFNGVDTAVPLAIVNTGITGSGEWHNYAVRYDRVGKEVEIFVDEVSRGTVDLTTFAGGAYQNFSNASVSVGANTGGGGNRVWTDNAQVGGVEALVQSPGPKSLVSYWNFDESNTGTGTAIDQRDSNNGAFQGTAVRTAGLIGVGAAQFNDTNGDGVNVGNGTGNNFSFSKGLTVEALVSTNWDGSDQAEIFRKEDGNDRILLSFQSAGNINPGADPGISFGINANGYSELDVSFDGVGGRPTLAQVADGNVHHVVATFDAETGLKSIFWDGLLIAQVDLGDDITLITGGLANAFIGSTNGGEPFPGAIDEVAIYGQALSFEEIQAHFQNVQQGRGYFETIPEPATFIMLALGGLGTLRRRRLAV